MNRKEPCSGVETRWFPGHVQPVRIGVYQRSMEVIGRCWMYSRWDGVQWHIQAPDVEGAEEATERSVYQRLPWRGLATPHPDIVLITADTAAREMMRKMGLRIPVTRGGPAPVSAEVNTRKDDSNRVVLTYSYRARQFPIEMPVSDLLLPLEDFSAKHVHPELLAVPLRDDDPPHPQD